eukprot:scaffold46964_cov29-Tisochrysis_lutea.AAC.1
MVMILFVSGQALEVNYALSLVTSPEEGDSARLRRAIEDRREDTYRKTWWLARRTLTGNEQMDLLVNCVGDGAACSANGTCKLGLAHACLVSACAEGEGDAGERGRGDLISRLTRARQLRSERALLVCVERSLLAPQEGSNRFCLVGRDNLAARPGDGLLGRRRS